MTEGNGASPSDLFSRLDAIAQEAPAEIERLEAHKAEIDAQIKRLKGIVRAVAPDAPEPRKRAPRTPGNHKPVGDVTTRRVGEAIKQLDAEAFTAKDVLEELRKDNPRAADGSVYSALRRLRELEFVGRAGKTPPRPGAPKGADLYRIDHVDALDQLGV